MKVRTSGGSVQVHAHLREGRLVRQYTRRLGAAALGYLSYYRSSRGASGGNIIYARLKTENLMLTRGVPWRKTRSGRVRHGLARLQASAWLRRS